MRKVLFGLSGVALIGAAVALILIVVVGANSSGSASRTVTQPDSAPAGDSAVTASQPADAPGGTHEGIAVHGHWTIEVRAQGGELVSRNEFENAYSDSPWLASVLSRGASPSWWWIFTGSGTTEPCPDGTPFHNCKITEAGNPTTGDPSVFKTLQVTVPGSGPNQNKLVLEGSFIAGATTSIDIVTTANKPCPATFAPATPCDSSGTSGEYNFTYRILDTPVAVAVGQQVLVTVVISFS
jgi:hypothetical protein